MQLRAVLTDRHTTQNIYCMLHNTEAWDDNIHRFALSYPANTGVAMHNTTSYAS